MLLNAVKQLELNLRTKPYIYALADACQYITDFSGQFATQLEAMFTFPPSEEEPQCLSYGLQEISNYIWDMVCTLYNNVLKLVHLVHTVLKSSMLMLLGWDASSNLC